MPGFGTCFDVRISRSSLSRCAGCGYDGFRDRDLSIFNRALFQAELHSRTRVGVSVRAVRRYITLADTP